MTPSALDFFHAERVEMCSMTAATEISPNVWLGPTPDPSVDLQTSALPSPSSKDPPFDIMIEASDIAQIPEPKAFKLLDDLLHRKANAELAENAIPQLEFPGSGAILPPTWSQAEVDGLLATCQWIYRQAHTPPSSPSGSSSPVSKRRDSKLSLSSSSSSGGGAADADMDVDEDGDGDSPMHTPSSSSTSSHQGHRILLHCTDGYTESSLLALAYYIFAEYVPVHTAWIALHRDLGRNFFAYATDVALLRAIQPRLLQASPKHVPEVGMSMLCPPTPEWVEKMDGSLPSRILDHLYLGNLGHANNLGLLRELGIGRVLSVGEPVGWGCEDEGDGEGGTEEGREEGKGKGGWKRGDWMFVDQTQDNGVDPLMGQFGRCLEFIGMSSSFPSFFFFLLCLSLSWPFFFSSFFFSVFEGYTCRFTPPFFFLISQLNLNSFTDPPSPHSFPPAPGPPFTTSPTRTDTLLLLKTQNKVVAMEPAP